MPKVANKKEYFVGSTQDDALVGVAVLVRNRRTFHSFKKVYETFSDQQDFYGSVMEFS